MATEAGGDRADDWAHEERRAPGKELVERRAGGSDECVIERVRPESSIDSGVGGFFVSFIFGVYSSFLRKHPA